MLRPKRRAIFPGGSSYPLDSERGVAEVDLEKMECEMQDESHQLHQCVNATAAPTVGALRSCRSV